MLPTREFLAGLIFALTLAAIVVRPCRLDEGLAAVVGAALMILVGVLSPAAALATLAGEWNVFLFFGGLMLIAAVADQAGFFDWAGALAAACAGGSARRLLVIGARSGDGELPPGPRSLGHTARFVLDHTPCPLLLLRRREPRPA